MISDAEYDILRNMQVIDREVFYYLEQRMDKKTGVIGHKSPVSKSGIALDLSERMTPGKRRACWVISASDVKHSLERLCLSGLLSAMSESGFNQSLIVARVFYVKWLQTRLSDQKQVDPVVDHRLTVCDEKNHSLNNGLNDKNKTESTEVDRQVDPTITVISSTTTGADKPFVMSIDWQPTESDLRAILFRSLGSKHKIEDIDARWLGEFVGYWFAMPGRAMTQRQWTAKYAANVVRYFGDADLVARKFGGQSCGVRVGQEAAFKDSGRVLPDYAKLPKDDNAMLNWSVRHGYGDPDPGDGWADFRAKLKQKINRRLESNGLEKVRW